MNIFTEVEKLEIIVVDGSEYLGVFEEKEKTIKHAMNLKDYKLRQWFELFNVEELNNIQMSKNEGFSRRKLNKHEKLEIDRNKALMKHVKDVAVRYYENQLYNTLDEEDR